MFRMKPAFAKGHMALDDAVQDAVANGKVAGELSLTVQNGSAMFDLMQYRMGFSMQVQQANQNHIRLEVSSNEPEGKVAIINLDQGTFDTLTGNDIIVTIGREWHQADAEPIGRAWRLRFSGWRRAVLYRKHRKWLADADLYPELLHSRSGPVERLTSGKRVEHRRAAGRSSVRWQRSARQRSSC